VKDLTINMAMNAQSESQRISGDDFLCSYVESYLSDPEEMFIYASEMAVMKKVLRDVDRFPLDKYREIKKQFIKTS
jgi:hypothetical protein